MDIINLKYKVTKQILRKDAWEIGAEVGDILTVQYWGGAGCSGWTLMKGDKAVCDLDSQCGEECCQLIEETI